MVDLMIVDDEIIIQQGLRNSIDWASHGIEVCCVASNGQEALRMLNAYAPDIVLMDIRMPLIDGIELSKIARNMFPDIYIIILTGYSDTDYMTGAISVGVNDYVMKLADSSKILNAVVKGRNAILQKKSKVSDELLGKNVLSFLTPTLKGNLLQMILKGNASQKNIADLARFLHINMDRNLCIAYFFNSADEDGGASQILNLEIAANQKYDILAAALDRRLVVAVFFLNDKSDIDQINAFMNHTLERNESASALFHTPIVDSADQLSAFYRTIVTYSNAFPWFSNLDSGEIRAVCDDSTVFDRLKGRVLMAFISQDNTTALALYEELMSEGRRILVDYEIFLAITREFVEAFLIVSQQENSIPERVKQLRQLDRPSDLLRFLHNLIEGDDLQDNHHAVRKVIAYVSQNYMHDMTLEAIARAVYLSPNYLSHVFRKSMNISIREYVHIQRIKVAMDILKHAENIKFYEIASTVGYQNYKEFSKHFLNIAGISAREYRRLFATVSNDNHAMTAQLDHSQQSRQ